MKELFTITPSFEVELNKEWIILVPEFKALVQSDKGSTGDYDGRKKHKARRLFAYIWFMLDFKSPIEDWDFAKKHEEALKYTSLTEADVSNAKVKAAYDKYEEIQLNAARALKTLGSVRKALTALDLYYENLDFSQTDKQGKLLNNPKEIAASISQLNKMFDEVDHFENRVRQQLKDSSTIRGQATLGDREGKKDATTTWNEEGKPNVNEPNYSDFDKQIQPEEEND